MRIVDVITSELNSDKLKLEEDIERVLNNKDLDAQNKVDSIKTLLAKVVSLEMSFVKFKTYTEIPPEQVAPQVAGAEQVTPQSVEEPVNQQNNPQQ